MVAHPSTMQDPSPTDFVQQPQSPHSRLTLLGGFELSCRRWPEHLPAAAERLVAYLSLEPEVRRRHIDQANTVAAKSPQAGAESGDMVVDVHELVILAQLILHGRREYSETGPAGLRRR
jgi:hypothetical protein